jgi:hypothetical protein
VGNLTLRIIVTLIDDGIELREGVIMNSQQPPSQYAPMLPHNPTIEVYTELFADATCQKQKPDDAGQTPIPIHGEAKTHGNEQPASS